LSLGKKFKKKCNFLVLRNAKNFGHGGSRKVVFNYAMKHKFDYVVIMHGDYQGKFFDLYLIIKKISI
jgi:glycosyltransferase involved in cell wall biosynthesis